MKTSRHHCSGFSLVEVMCAILILGVGLLGLVQGLTTALASTKESEMQTTASLIAAGRIEMLQADGFVVDGEETGECDEIPLYRWRQTITSTSLDGLHEVQVTVENVNTDKAVYELRTLLFDPSLPPLGSTGDETTSSKRKPGKNRRQGTP